MHALFLGPLLDWLRDTWRLLVFWLLVLLAWSLGAGAVFVELVRRAAVLPDGAQDGLVLVLGAVLIGAKTTRSLLRRSYRASHAGAASPAVHAATLAPAVGASHPAFARLLASYGDRDFVDWVLARVDPAAPVEEAVDYASQWHSTWRQSVGFDEGPARRARHEAAHAIVAHELGCTVTDVTIERAGDSGGRANFILPVPFPTVQDGAWILITALLAGQSTDHARRLYDGGSRGDITQVTQLVATILSTGLKPAGYDGPLTSDALILVARARADEILAARDEELAVLTAQLVEQRTMSGAAARAVLGPVREEAPAST